MREVWSFGDSTRLRKVCASIQPHLVGITVIHKFFARVVELSPATKITLRDKTTLTLRKRDLVSVLPHSINTYATLSWSLPLSIVEHLYELTRVLNRLPLLRPRNVSLFVKLYCDHSSPATLVCAGSKLQWAAVEGCHPL
jgi:hypothetical protein